MCGIAGYISRKKKPFDYSGFCTLGIANDARGGDSCGIFIDGLNQYGVDDEKYFSVFFYLNKSLKSIKTAQIALLHCRKASVGVINKKTAQPVVIRNKRNKPSFVLLHNGTIHNYEELAKKYIPNVDIKDMTDSQVMARIFYDTGYKVLDEYNGSAVFTIVDYRNPEPRIFLWKGSTKKTENSKKEEEERPLYYCYDGDRLIFSSIAINMMALRKYITVRSLKPNILWEYKNDRLVKAGEYKRVGMIQSKVITPVTHYTNNFPTHTSFNYNLYDDDYEYSSYGRWNKYNGNNVTMKVQEYISYSMYDNLYRVGSTVAHGKYRCSAYGYVLPDDNTSNNALTLYFFNGHLVYNNKCLVFLNSLRRRFYNYNEFDRMFRNLVGFFSVQQVYVDKEMKFMYAVTPFDSKVYTGFIYPVITSTAVFIQNGVRMSSSYDGTGGRTNLIDKVPNYDFKTIKKRALKMIEEEYEV